MAESRSARRSQSVNREGQEITTSFTWRWGGGEEGEGGEEEGEGEGDGKGDGDKDLGGEGCLCDLLELREEGGGEMLGAQLNILP